uniref:Uncharacterized protein n=1 Tax=Panagrolaimus superbus TaxID=310955 RepID=A0A914Y8X4_9BILA
MYVFKIIFKDRQFICPNSGNPKLGEDGAAIQCLPGQASDVVCGRGFSCFFSGFNYQCCPTAEEDYDEQIGTVECPTGSLSILDSTGNLLRCNPRTGGCPKSNQFCSRQNSQAICCESLSKPKPTGKPTTLPTPRQAFTDSPPTKSVHPIRKSSIEESILDLECPRNALTVLSDTGEPFTCNSVKKCPSSSMYCHRVGRQSICCESLSTAKNDLDITTTKKPEEKPESSGFNPLKYTPEEALRHVDELEIQKDLERAIVEQTTPEATTSTSRATTKKIIKHRNFADNENTRRITLPQYVSREKITAEPEISSTLATQTEKLPRRSNIKDNHVRTETEARAFGIQTNPEENESESTGDFVEYKPHNSGGYAFSRKLEKINARAQNPNQKALAQQFLVEQIREGWPYNEKFYRPETTAVLKRGSRTEAIIHFPN